MIKMTPRAQQALELKANGYQSKQIAEKLGVHRCTVEFHLANARRSLNAKSLCHAVALAAVAGLIHIGEIGGVFLLCWACLFGHGDIRVGPRAPTSRLVRRVE